jgi:hypothetical protein
MYMVTRIKHFSRIETLKVRDVETPEVQNSETLNSEVFFSDLTL